MRHEKESFEMCDIPSSIPFRRALKGVGGCVNRVEEIEFSQIFCKKVISCVLLKKGVSNYTNEGVWVNVY
jgi:hypothetical protein